MGRKPVDKRTKPKKKPVPKGKSRKVLENPIAYVIRDKHFGDFEVKNTANAWWIDKAKVDALIQAFKIDASIKEARVYAGISQDQWNYFIKTHPEFSKIKDDIKELPILKARETIAKGVGESYSNAMDFMKRKKRLEFGDNIDHTTGGDKIVILPAELHAKRNNNTTPGPEPDSE